MTVGFPGLSTDDLGNRYRHGRAPLQNAALALLWTGFEQLLLNQFPGVGRLATPAWEDIYERERWQASLQTQGYQPFTEQAFVKAVGSR